jgi:Fic family protein
MNAQIIKLTVSPEIISRIAGIEKLVGRIEGIKLSKPTPQLRQKNLARSIAGSTGIEGNSCSAEQVEAIIHGNSVALSKKEQLEIKNSIDAYNTLAEFDPYSIKSLLNAHSKLMGNGLMLSPGNFRKSPVEVYITETKTRSMPDWKVINTMMQELFDYLNNSTDIILLKSIVFHFQFVNIHPFIDGNGRTARLWQTRLLMEEHPIFEFLDVESMIFENRIEYYQQIRNAQENGDSAGFAQFMLEQIEHSLESLWKNSGIIHTRYMDRIKIAQREFQEKEFSRGEYQQLFKTISSATASRDLAKSTEKNILTRTGDKRTAQYQFM